MGRHQWEGVPHGTSTRYRNGCRCRFCCEAVQAHDEGRRHWEMIQNGLTHEPAQREKTATGNYTPRTRLGILPPHSDRMRLKILFSELRKEQIAREDAEGDTVLAD